MFAPDHPLSIMVQEYRNLLPYLEKPEIPANDFSSAMSDVARHVFLVESTLSKKVSALHGAGQSAGAFFRESASPNVFFDALFSLSPIATALLNSKGIVLRVNQSFLGLFGYEQKEVVMNEIDSLVGRSPKVKRLVSLFNKKMVSADRPSKRITTREKKDGTRFHVIVSMIPFTVKDASFSFCVYYDVDQTIRTQHALRNTTRQLGKTIETTLLAFSKMIEERDPYTAQHQRRVANIAWILAEHMLLDIETKKTVYISALLHDVGKISVPGEILNKPGTLNEDEMKIIRRHSESSYRIVRAMEFKGPVAQCIHQHHERLDGSGYPNGLNKEEILPEAQILAVADVFEAMTSHRPYRPSRGYELAIKELETYRNIKYNASAVDAVKNLVMTNRISNTSLREPPDLSC